VTRSGNDGNGYSRRGFLTLAAPAIVALTPLRSLAHSRAAPERSLNFHNLHTGDRLEAVYHAEGRYLADAIADINWILRDWRTDEQAAMDHRLLDLLHQLHGVMDSSQPFEIISGYRSPRTNRKLASRSRGVAKRSLHMRAMAADVSLPGRDLSTLCRAAKSLRRGGVGFYPKPGFIHVDSGHVRSWGAALAL
jgi:uncharacterized protein YcbK (DUF882 family)